MFGLKHNLLCAIVQVSCFVCPVLHAPGFGGAHTHVGLEVQDGEPRLKCVHDGLVCGRGLCKNVIF